MLETLIAGNGGPTPTQAHQAPDRAGASSPRAHWTQVCFASVTNSYQAKRAWLIILCSGRRRDIIALFASDFLKTNTNVIHQAERTDVQ
jgi:hypothetical protein